jgi:hypothetical protein
MFRSSNAAKKASIAETTVLYYGFTAISATTDLPFRLHERRPSQHSKTAAKRSSAGRLIIVAQVVVNYFVCTSLASTCVIPNVVRCIYVKGCS